MPVPRRIRLAGSGAVAKASSVKPASGVVPFDEISRVPGVSAYRLRES